MSCGGPDSIAFAQAGYAISLASFVRTAYSYNCTPLMTL
jgi:hypothetical protein